MITVASYKKTFYVGFFRKKVEAVKNISFEVAEKEIFGFLGPNGSGKTTTIKALLGLVRPDSGTLRLLGHEIDSMEWRSQVGYMPEHPTFYEYLSAFEMVTWFGRLAGLSRHDSEREATRHLERVGLGHALHRRLRGYSKGMLQRAGLAQALIGSPKLLILDEPMTGLDPMGRKEIRELILELKSEGRTVFYSTHILPDVEMTCDRVCIVHKGETKRTGRINDILTETTRGITVAFVGVTAERAAQVMASNPSARFDRGTLELLFAHPLVARQFVQDMNAGGAMLERFEPHRENLETIFVRALSENASDRASPMANVTGSSVQGQAPVRPVPPERQDPKDEGRAR